MGNRDDNTILKFYEESEKLKSIPYKEIEKFILSTDYFIIDGCLFFIFEDVIHTHIPKEKQKRCNIRKVVRKIRDFWFCCNDKDILYTTVDKTNKKAQDFVRRIGFIKQSCNNELNKYYINKTILDSVWGK